jgi:hypothetical protein
VLSWIESTELSNACVGVFLPLSTAERVDWDRSDSVALTLL